MATHLRFNPDGHSRVSESIQAGRTGYGPCDPQRVLEQGIVKLYEMHPGWRPFELNDTLNHPWISTLTVSKAYRVQGFDTVRTVIEFDPSTLTTEYVTTTPTSNVGGAPCSSYPGRHSLRMAGLRC